MLIFIKNILIKIGELERRVIFLIIALAILIPMIFPDYFRVPITASQTSKDFFNSIEELKPKSTILVTFEY